MASSIFVNVCRACVLPFMLLAACQPLAATGDKNDQPNILRAAPVPASAVVPAGAAVLTAGDGTTVIAGGIDAATGEPLATLVLFKAGQPDKAKGVGGAVTGARTASLPGPLAYSAAAAASGKVYLAGGLGAGMQPSARVYAIDPRNPDSIQQLPDLPQPAAFGSAVVLNGKLVVGGQAVALEPFEPVQELLVLELARPESGWQRLAVEAAGGRHAVPFNTRLAVRRDEVVTADALYLLGGWATEEGGSTLRAVDQVWKFIEGGGRYAGWRSCAPVPGGRAVTSAAPLGPTHLAVTLRDVPAGGAAGALTAAGPDGASASVVWAYHSITDTWIPLNPTPQGRDLSVTANGGGLLVAADSGAGARFSHLWVEFVQRKFGFIDYGVIIFYFVLMIVMGRFFSRRNKGTADYFLGGRRIPWWAAGLSIWATAVSAISFMSLPAKTYSANWLRINESIFSTANFFLATIIFVPLIRRLNIVTMADYIEMRLSRSIALFSSGIGMVSAVCVRLAVTLYLPSIALSAVSGWDPIYCILAMGLITTFYAFEGGFTAVVWTDVLQALLMIGGCLLTFFLIVGQTEGSFVDLVSSSAALGKFHAFDWSLNLSTWTMWIFLFWAFGDFFGKGSQENMQRVFATDGEKSARWSMYTVAIIAIPTALAFFFMGTALFAFYRAHPNLLNPNLPIDNIAPLFVVQQVPRGVAGAIIAGIFAAAMSTAVAAMNGPATVAINNFYPLFRPAAPDRERMLAAKVVSALCGIIGTAVACWMSRYTLGTVWDKFSFLLTVVLGGMGCIFPLAMFSTRAHSRGVWVGMVYGTLMGWILWYVKEHPALHMLPVIGDIARMHFYMWGTFLFLSSCAVAYVASLILPDPGKPLAGLTVWTPKRG